MLAAVQVFNVSILALLRALGSVRTSMVGSCLVPLSIVAFTLPLPYLVRVRSRPVGLVGACTASLPARTQRRLRSSMQLARMDAGACSAL